MRREVMKMRKTYEMPAIEVIDLAGEDILTSSYLLPELPLELE